jgi:putative redox protein
MASVPEVMPKTGVVVQDSPAGPFAETILVGKHVLLADEPLSGGGNDTGPNPYDYLLAALGTCTGMTVRSYARVKNWPLEHITVRLKHDKIYAVDCADCETKEGKIDKIDRVIELQGPLSDDQRKRLLEIAERCPVHRTLTSEISIRTTLA